MARNGAATKQRILDAAQRLVLDRGFAATSVDAVIAAAETTKGAFFNHFPSKAALGRALIERYAAADEQMLEGFMTHAEEVTNDPARQLVLLIHMFEKAAAEMSYEQPGCLFVSFIYEGHIRGAGSQDLIVDSILSWRNRIEDKLVKALADRPETSDVDVRSLADHVFTVFEGGFVLGRAMGSTSHLEAQLAHLRHYFELLLDVKVSEFRATELTPSSARTDPQLEQEWSRRV